MDEFIFIVPQSELDDKLIYLSTPATVLTGRDENASKWNTWNSET